MLSDIVTPDLPPDHKWGRTKPKKRSLPEIVALVEEMRQVWGDCPATRAYQEKLLEEAGLKAIPHDRKSFEQIVDELDDENEKNDENE